MSRADPESECTWRAVLAIARLSAFCSRLVVHCFFLLRHRAAAALHTHRHGSSDSAVTVTDLSSQFINTIIIRLSCHCHRFVITVHQHHHHQTQLSLSVQLLSTDGQTITPEKVSGPQGHQNCEYSTAHKLLPINGLW